MEQIAAGRLPKAVISRASRFAVVLLATLGAGTRFVAAEDDPPLPEHSSSSHLAEAMASVMPKYNPPAKPAAGEPTLAPAPEPAPTGSAASIVRLPTYIVRERRPLSPDDVTTDAGREKASVQKYYGGETSLFRLLNTVTISGLWSKIPVLGRATFVLAQSKGLDAGPAAASQALAASAVRAEKQDRISTRLNELNALESTPPPSAPPTTSPEPKP